MRNSIFGIIPVCILFMVSIDAWPASVYKCKNQQGELIYQESPCIQELQPVSSWAASTEAVQQGSAPGKSVDKVLILKQSRDGHYYLDGSVNGKPLTFVIDTGASEVALPREVAMSAQIYCKDKIMVLTANGAASACTTVIPTLKFGQFMVKNASAHISPNLGQPLLGMSILQQFKIEQDKGVMRISIRD